jgi:hypothetical protein
MLNILTEVTTKVDPITLKEAFQIILSTCQFHRPLLNPWRGKLVCLSLSVTSDLVQYLGVDYVDVETSLLRYGINYGRKKFCETGPWSNLY